MATAVASAPASATRATADWSRCQTRIAVTPKAEAPALIPMTSGEASWLRSIVWKTTPPAP